MLQLTNTLTRKKEPFTPMVPGKVRMYLCGPTVYNFTHIGNARPAVFFDVARRYLEYSGFEVTYVSNYTDVDDKIIDRARQDKVPCDTITEKYIVEYRKDMAALGVRVPDVTPRVTDHIPQIVEFIKGLIERGHAYAVADGEVFYSVRSFAEYGKLSGKKIDDLLTGVRIQPGELKRDPLDFSLWKPQKGPDEPAWNSPWGKGRPGWHIECSAMAMEYLGETFDIHCGGIDLIHPHHENEIAQSEGRTGKTFARVWLHNLLLNINNEKMSKSLGNIFLNREFIEKHTAEVLKFLLLSGHYRSTIDFSDRSIRDAQRALHRFYSAAKKCGELTHAKAPAPQKPTIEETSLITMGDKFLDGFREAMDDDLNTAKVIGLGFEYVRAINGYFDRKGYKLTGVGQTIAKKFLENQAVVGKVMNLLGEEPAAYLKRLRGIVLTERGIEPSSIDQALRERTEARATKNFAQADAIRDQLLQQGIQIMDTPAGTEWDIVFS